MVANGLDVLGSLAEIVNQPGKKAAKQATAILPTLSKDEKWKILKGVEAELNKQFSTTTSIVKLGSKVNIAWPSIPSGITSLDYEVLGTGGLAKGRIMELYGPESSGKTTLALEFVAAAQAAGGIAAYIDAEHALDPTYMAKLGVNVDELLVSQPDSGEQGLETCEALVKSRAVDLVVVDSVAALVPQAELDGDMGDSHMGLQARLMSQAMRKLRGVCSINSVPVIFINQIREKLGVMFGNPETTPGGRALKFYSSVRLSVTRKGGDDGKIMSGDALIGHVMKIRAVKNKMGVPARTTEVDLIYGKGVDKEADLIRVGKDIGVLETAGAWIRFKGENVGNGIGKTIDNLKDNAKLFAEVKDEIAAALKSHRETDAA